MKPRTNEITNYNHGSENDTTKNKLKTYIEHMLSARARTPYLSVKFLSKFRPIFCLAIVYCNSIQKFLRRTGSMYNALKIIKLGSASLTLAKLCFEFREWFEEEW